jgi:outer membrane murein-binding lipoprotein Lpp
MKTSARARGMFVVIFAGVLLSGCAHRAQHDWLAQDSFATPEQLEAGFVRLEASLADSCVSRDAVDQTHAQLIAGLNEQFETLRDELRRRDEEARQAARACPPPPAPRPPVPMPLPADKPVLGRVEWVGLPSLGTYLKARIDTGANLASISAAEITRFERDGANWIRFKLGLTDDDVAVDAVRERWIELPVVRNVRIVQASGNERRPVVRLPMTLGGIEQHVEFTVNDRSHLPYPVLLGRRFMMDIALVDVSRSYVHPRPEFPGGKPAAQARRDQLDQDEAED